MGERKKYTLTLNGTKYPISTEEPEEYIRRIEFFLNSRIQNAKDKTGMIYSDSITLALLAIEVADSLFKTQKQFNELKAETNKLLEKYDELSAQHDSNCAEIDDLENEIRELREKILILKLGGTAD
ncbi:MAG: cell division protein ZapA [Clostridia bacterium]|jgi:cell division protein ZapA (FtsZ GTPase activity inhibitor)|nr:cell division protein ZapA [Clostridia bacterium]MBO7503404.1 cell division protein ZapA [Clostridia bacterium]MBO7659199.1 cell division protein ZapA [Clostridia bacterium]MBP5665689.1 cell division protein ZapA [Clostridia bacterium]MBP5765899.1 cell division protein ZapA [Clostridia bacterium]